MDPIYTEVEFELFDRTPGPFYQALKAIPMTINYRQVSGEGERFASIVLNDRNLPALEKVALAHSVEIARRLDVNQERFLIVMRGDFEGFIDGYDTRDERFWTGLGTFLPRYPDGAPVEHGDD